jgi:hypothetical protein
MQGTFSVAQQELYPFTFRNNVKPLSYEKVCAVDSQVRDSEPLVISVIAQKIPRTVKFINKPSLSSLNWLVRKFKITIKSWHRSNVAERELDHAGRSIIQHMTTTCVNALKHTKNFCKKRRRTCRHDNRTMHKTNLKTSLEFNQLNYEQNSIFLSTFTCIGLTPHLLNCDTMIMLEIATNDKQYIA